MRRPLRRPASSSGPVAPKPPSAPSPSPTPAAPLPHPHQNKMSKANWSSEMTTIFCKLAANEKLKGNRPKKFLNPAWYKNVEVGFF
ncbi:hypothetical protein ZWY2020_038001 [Hordeum vulgare]|nr:hypothetical protein ZWY2020_038001 [Hordeum vulgare]